MNKNLIIIVIALITILYGCQQDDVTTAEADTENTETVDENSSEETGEESSDKADEEKINPNNIDRNGGIQRLFEKVDQYDLEQDYYQETITFELSKYEMAVLTAGQTEPKILTTVGDTDVVLMGVEKDSGYLTGEGELVVEVALFHTFKEEGGTLLTNYTIAEEEGSLYPAVINVMNDDGNEPTYIFKAKAEDYVNIPEEFLRWHLSYDEVRQSERWRFEISKLKVLGYEGK
ncbi:hypothetical protein [Aquisalibacillus elongatus]|uniref:Uncharacterized protein n=1 Tax=Aquisalibacillus elongatus TaxID=485577 RepID=A0A3N5BAD9_9BACI|nr:hypothetical protein [Aquisalibacillus elongatus]RPF53919.1 hypothetical protein EDC24_1104 [Aquisalibacillus elongatus]